MRSDEEELYVPSLQRPELTRLVDFLDRVRALPLASLRLTKRTLRSPMSPRLLKTPLRDVYANYKPSSAIARSCRLRTSSLVISLESVVIPLPSVVFPTCGRARTMTSRYASLSKRLTSPANIPEGPMLCSEFVACLAHSCVREAFTMTSLSVFIYWNELVRVLYNTFRIGLTSCANLFIVHLEIPSSSAPHYHAAN